MKKLYTVSLDTLFSIEVEGNEDLQKVALEKLVEMIKNNDELEFMFEEDDF